MASKGAGDHSEPSDLAVATRVTGLRAAPGWYTAELPRAWNFLTPSGGVLMTVALRAMQAELGDASYRPVSATTVFCSPVPDGPLEIRVEVLRRGGAAPQVRAALSSTALPGPGLEVSATFARDQSGPELDAARGDPGGVARVADQRHHLDAQLVGRGDHRSGVREGLDQTPTRRRGFRPPRG